MREQNPIGKKIWLSIHLRNFGSHATVRPSDHPSAPQGNQCEISHCLASMETLQPDIAHPCCGQLTAVKTCTGYPLISIARLGVDPSRLYFSLKLSTNKFINGSFAFSLGLICILLKILQNMIYIFKAIMFHIM